MAPKGKAKANAKEKAAPKAPKQKAAPAAPAQPNADVPSWQLTPEEVAQLHAQESGDATIPDMEGGPSSLNQQHYLNVERAIQTISNHPVFADIRQADPLPLAAGLADYLTGHKALEACISRVLKLLCTLQ